MKTVLITGASSGIGKACVQLFAEKGYFVGGYDINEKALSEVMMDLPTENHCFSACDVSKAAQVNRMFKQFTALTHGKLDVLVNCAGVLSGGPLTSLTEAQISHMLNVNCKGLTLVAQKAYPWLKETKGSTLINIGSASGLYGIPSLSVYSSTKFYVKGLTEALNIEWQDDGIHVCSVMPPFVNTHMLDNVPEKTMDFLGVDLEPEDVAEQIFKASQGRNIHYPLGFKMKALSGIGMRFPSPLKKSIIGAITGY